MKDKCGDCEWFGECPLTNEVDADTKTCELFERGDGS